jgi:hypothetical protein
VKIVRLLDDLPGLDDPDWHQANVPNRLHYLHYRVLAVLCDLVTADHDTAEQGWLEAFGDRLTPDESTLLARAAGASQRLDSLLRWWNLAAAHDAAPTADEETDARTYTVNDIENGGGGVTSSPVDVAAHPLAALANAYRDTILNLLRRDVPESDNTKNDDKSRGQNVIGDKREGNAATATDDGGDAADT